MIWYTVYTIYLYTYVYIYIWVYMGIRYTLAKHISLLNFCFRKDAGINLFLFRCEHLNIWTPLQPFLVMYSNEPFHGQLQFPSNHSSLKYLYKWSTTVCTESIPSRKPRNLSICQDNKHNIRRKDGPLVRDPWQLQGVGYLLMLQKSFKRAPAWQGLEWNTSPLKNHWKKQKLCSWNGDVWIPGGSLVKCMAWVVKCMAASSLKANLGTRMDQPPISSETKIGATVDGWNPAPPRMMIIPLFIGF